MDARRRMTVLAGGFAASQMLYVAARLGLADHLARGPLTVEALAAESGARDAPLRRVVRALASFGVFSLRDGMVANTPLSECLRAGADESVRDLVLLYGEEHYHAMSELLRAVKSGGSAFEHAYRKPHFSYLAGNPQAAQAFHDASSTSIARTARSLAAEYDFGRATRIVDVGGRAGQLIRAALRADRRLTGVLIETAGLAAKARARVHADGLDERCEVEIGDILSSVPRDGDVYLLGHVLHGLDDEQAACALRACGRAAAPGGRVLVIEPLIPDGAPTADDAQLATLSDVVALAISGGRERTLEEMAGLIEASRLRVNRVLALTSGDSIVEAVRG
jgi:SAM-dependent methyltransferase